MVQWDWEWVCSERDSILRWGLWGFMLMIGDPCKWLGSDGFIEIWILTDFKSVRSPKWKLVASYQTVNNSVRVSLVL